MIIYIRKEIICHSKRKKKQQMVQRYWKQQASTLDVHSDDALEHDLQDEGDHTCWPPNPQAATTWLPKRN